LKLAAYSHLTASPPIIRRYAILTAKIGLGALIVYWLIDTGQLDLSTYQSLLSSANLWLLAGIFVSQIVSLTIVLGRWWLLVRAQGILISFSDVLRIGFQGLFSSLVLPGVVGPDGIRILYLRNHHREQMLPGISSILMDRATGFIGMLILGLLSSMLYLALSGNDRLNTLLAVNGALLTIALVGILVVCGFIPQMSFKWVRKLGFVTNTLDALRIYGQHKLALVVSVLLSILSHLCMCIAWCLGMIVFGIAPPVLGVVAGTSMLLIVRTLPLTPMGLGITDGIAESLYGMMGISTGAEIQMLIRIVTVLIFLLCGVAFLYHRPQTEFK
jgi:uncharacterized protein (TIRG00374 family)